MGKKPASLICIKPPRGIIFDIEIKVWSRTNFHDNVVISPSSCLFLLLFLLLFLYSFLSSCFIHSVAQWSNLNRFPPTCNMTMKMFRLVEIFHTFGSAFRYYVQYPINRNGTAMWIENGKCEWLDQQFISAHTLRNARVLAFLWNHNKCSFSSCNSISVT